MPSHAARGSPAVKRARNLGSRAPKTERYQGAQSMEVARVLWKEYCSWAPAFSRCSAKPWLHIMQPLRLVSSVSSAVEL